MKSFLLACLLVASSVTSFATVTSFPNLTSSTKDIPMHTEALTENYYDQFLFEVTGDCKQIETVWFQSAGSWDDMLLGKDAKGREMYASLHLQLFKDGTYWSDYAEYTVLEVLPDGKRFEVTFRKEVESTWNVVQNQLTLTGLGSGIPVKMGQQGTTDGIKFNFSSALNNPRVLDGSVNISRVGTNRGPRGASINEYCGIK